MGIADTAFMMNAQILPKIPDQPGQNTQPIPGRQGPSPARTLEARPDASDPAPRTAPANSRQDGKREASDSPNDFKHTLTEKMADPAQAQTPQESLAESPEPTDAALQVAMAQNQAVAQVVTQPSAPRTQSMPDAIGIPVPDVGSVEPVEPPPALQLQAPDSGVEALLGQEPKIQVTVDSPVAVPGESVVISGKPTNTQASESPTRPLPEPSSAHIADPNPARELLSGQGVEVAQSPEASPAQKNTQAVTEPAQQITLQTVQPEGSPSEQGPKAQPSQIISPRDTGTESAQAQPNIAEARQSEVTPETKPVPAFEVQSIPEAAPRDIKGKVEPLDPPSMERVPRTNAPEPIQVIRPGQQTTTTMLESSLTQPANTPETSVALEVDQSAMPAVTAPETQAAPEAAEVTLPRSLNPTSNPLPRQIQESIALGVQQNSRQLVIRLDPPELGRVAIRFQEDSQGITGVLEVQKSQTRHDIQQALPEIVQQLQDSGVQIKRVEVLLSADADAETFEDQAFAQAQDQNLEQQQTSEQNNARRTPTHGWPSSREEGIHARTQNQYASDEGIDLLI